MTDQPDFQGRQASQDARRRCRSQSVSQNKDPLPVTFHRRELDQILWIYGRMWRRRVEGLRAIDHLKDKAVFSVFKRSGEMPLYRIEKNPKLASKQAPTAL